MAITIHCQCSREIKISEALAGQPMRCPSCGRRHIVPQVDVEVEPAPAEQCCRDCQTPLAFNARFCHCCGLPTDTPKPVTVKRSFAEQQRVDAERQQQASALEYPAWPAQHHASPPRPAPMADPFAPMPVAAVPPAPPPPNMAAAPNRPDPSGDGPFAKTSTRRVKRHSPLGNVAMACAYMSILLGLIGMAFAVPLAQSLGCLGGETTIAAEHAESLLGLQKGVLALIGIFAAFGMLTGFLGLFHFGYKKSGAFWGLILCFLIGAMASGASQQLQARADALSAPPSFEHRVSNKSSWKNGCTFGSVCSFGKGNSLTRSVIVLDDELDTDVATKEDRDGDEQ